MSARRSLKRADHRFAGRHSERPAHEIKILDRDRHHLAFKASDAHLHGVLQTRLGAGILEPVGIAALVAEFERVERDLGQRNVFKLAAIEH